MTETDSLSGWADLAYSSRHMVFEHCAEAIALLNPFSDRLGDLNIAEPRALIGFAGPRVIEQTIRQKLPDGFQRAEFLLERGMLDLVVDRRELKTTIGRALRFMRT